MWDIATGGMRMLDTFWAAVRTVVPDAAGEQAMVGTAEGDIAERLTGAGLVDVTAGSLTATTDYAGFDDFWEPFTYGVGPAGSYLATMPSDAQAQVREACRASVPQRPFSVEARAWFARGTVPQADR